MSDELNPPADRPLSEEELAELERLESEATVAPWPLGADAVLIPTMRNALPRLLKELRELREAAQKCTCEQEGTTHTCPLHGLVSLLREAHEEIKELREHLDAYERWARQAPIRVDVEITEDGEDG